MPSPKPRAECGCSISEWAFGSKKEWNYNIVYCPLHEAAPQMLETLRRLSFLIDHTDDRNFKGIHLDTLITAASTEDK